MTSSFDNGAWADAVSDDLITCEWCGIKHRPFKSIYGDPPHHCKDSDLFKRIRIDKQVAIAHQKRIEKLEAALLTIKSLYRNSEMSIIVAEILRVAIAALESDSEVPA